MLLEYFQKGGPLMYGVAACWLLVLTVILDRCLYWFGVVVRRPVSLLRKDLRQRVTDRAVAKRRLKLELLEATRNLDRLSSLTHLATSVGLFGTVLGICRSFITKGESSVAEAVGSGLSTALFTTLGGLSVFLVGQLFLILFHGFTEALERRGLSTLEEVTAGGGS